MNNMMRKSSIMCWFIWKYVYWSQRS